MRLRKTGKMHTIGQKKAVFFALLLFFFVCQCRGTAGLKEVKNYSPLDYNLLSQNWSIIQDSRGIIYAANQGGILEFDGVSWQTIDLPNKSARSLTIAPDGIIYAGGVNEIGFLKPDDHGKLRYVSLLSHIDENHRTFTYVFQACSSKQGVFFRESKKLFRWLNGRMTVWQPQKTGAVFRSVFTWKGHCYVQEAGTGLLRVKDDALLPVPGSESFSKDKIYAALPFDGQRLLIGTRFDGFRLYDGSKSEPFATAADDYLKEHRLYHGISISKDTFALATLTGGLVIIDKHGHLLEIIGRASGLQNENIKYIFQDTGGNLWLGLNDGISRIEYSSPLTTFDDRSGLYGIVLSLCRHKGRLVAGTSRGVYVLKETAQGKPPEFHIVNGIPANCWSLLSAGDMLLAGSDSGIFSVDFSKRKPGEHSIRRITAASEIQSYVLTKSLSRPGCVWVGTGSGLILLKRLAGTWRIDYRFQVPGLEIHSIVEEKKEAETLWLGTRTAGVLKIVFKENSKPKVQQLRSGHGLPDGEVYAARIAGQVRFATPQGLYRFDGTSRSFAPDLLLGDTFAKGRRNVFRMVEDRNGHIWFHSGSENFHAVPRGGGSYTVDNTPFRKIPRIQVNAIVPDGRFIYFATSRNVIVYDSSDNKNYNLPFRALIRRIIVKGHVPVYDPFGTGQKQGKPAVYDFENRNLRFETAAPFFEKETGTRYRYFLQGFDDRWSDWTTETYREYQSLNFGSYTFKVQAGNVYGTLSRAAAYTFRILPPWYVTWWAISCYAVVLFLLLFLFVKWRSRKLVLEKRRLENIIAERTGEISRANVQLQQKTIQLEKQSEKLTELDKVKSRFFANISHEFRTPLTLIMGPLEQIRSESGDKSQGPGKRIDLVYRNARRLLGLINQLLDLSKLESGKMKLQTTAIDLVHFLKAILEPFQLAASGLRSELIFDCPKDSITLYIDPEKVEKIITNLLSNALKFTPAGGTITVSVGLDPGPASQNEDSHPAGGAEQSGDSPLCGGHVIIAVKDTGSGIPEDQLPHIFERFYQAGQTVEHRRKGSGIGLALVKELVELHHGDIAIDSRRGEESGTELTLRFPLGKAHLSPAEISGDDSISSYEPAVTSLLPAAEVEAEVMPEAGEQAANEVGNPAVDRFLEGEKEEKNIILIVEDNADLRYYIRTALEPGYVVEEAGDGKEGIEKAQSFIPDLIISDIMMPEKDGYELCRVIKQDVATSHIPVILLTAKSGEEDILQGLETGADDYITKPFSTKLLCARIKNIIDLRRQLQQGLSREMIFRPSRMRLSKVDKEFLRDLQKAMDKELSDPDLNVEGLSKQLYMSRTTLYRKIQALSGDSPTDFIRAYRLKRALKMLKSGYDSVTEVAFEVGFASRAYFTKCFKEKFDRLPSDYLSAGAEES